MKNSRGRFRQNMLLRTDKNVSRFLLETVLFKESSFYDFLGKYSVISIKPAFGPGEIVVCTDRNVIKIFIGSSNFVFLSKEEAFHYLIKNELQQKINIIQPKNPSNSQIYFELPITIHLNSSTAFWEMRFKETGYRSLPMKCRTPIFLHTIKYLAIDVARKLGEYYPECQTIVVKFVYDLDGGIWIQDTVLHLSISKWSQYNMLVTRKSLIAFVPDTDIFTFYSFMSFIKNYRGVIIKPCLGQNGIGIVKVIAIRPRLFEIHYGNKKIIKETLAETYNYLNEVLMTDKYYLVQQHLQLVQIENCPIDVRVITEKDDSSWTVTRKVVKIAANDFFVTNVARKVQMLSDAVQVSSIAPVHYERLNYRIDKLCIAASNQLGENLIDITLIGFDIGITQREHLYIIEGNYKPDNSMFSEFNE